MPDTVEDLPRPYAGLFKDCLPAMDAECIETLLNSRLFRNHGWTVEEVIGKTPESSLAA